MEGQFSDAEEEAEVILDKLAEKLKEVTTIDSEIFRNLPEDEVFGEESPDEEEFSEPEDDLQLYEDRGMVKQSSGMNTQRAPTRLSSFQPSQSVMSKYSSRIHVGAFQGAAHEVKKALDKSDRRVDAERTKLKDKKDRATIDKVLDDRTRMVLFKLFRQDKVTKIAGNIKEGKEANVYLALSSAYAHEALAIKIFKTSILDFKDRHKYIAEEFRFRHGYARRNPRKMVRLWAEKEKRNLERMAKVGLPVPAPLEIRENVLVMEFIGENFEAAPRLAQVTPSVSKAREFYYDLVNHMWDMYNLCRLVHADLSEYNLLVHRDKLVIIDVSQSVEHDHPNALEFLRRDCREITKFFRKHGVAVMTVQELFHFITDATITQANKHAYLQQMLETIAERNLDDLPDEEKVQEEVFQSVFIPKRLDEVVHFERDIRQARAGAGDQLIYKTITGLSSTLEVKQVPDILQRDSGEEDSSSFSDDHDDYDDGGKFQSSARPRDESPDSKKARKKAVKDAKAEKRKTKVPKHVKKRKEKIAQRK
ncbi:serine/threonine-protein kinase RIO1 [Phlebotomus argentipes]|uniref:serine/threonine-protein kinase RIO1 n=1 Tax=Phlebotomus argentipes TaxID=94469 RepID=UPI002892F7CC|nr:serine/threonine-protein kinase RIO1 [Phlebotomus argentipes]